MIKIIKDINCFGFVIYKDAEVYPPKNIVNGESGVFTIVYKDDSIKLTIPLICINYKKTTIEFLDEIYRLNTI